MEKQKDKQQLKLQFPVSNPLGNEGLLFLTYNRSTQQLDTVEVIKRTKERMRGKPFAVRSRPPKFCKQNSVAIITTDKSGEPKKVVFSRIGCNSWTCPSCSLKKALKVKYYFKDICMLNDLSYFLTLTLDPQNIPGEFISNAENNTHKYITKIFNHFITILKRNKINRGEEKLKYVWVLEYQKNGNAHLHILLNKFLPIQVVRNLWTHVGGGLMMRIEKVKDIKGISSYVSDYIVKGLKGTDKKINTFKYFERRYSISRSCTRPATTIKEALQNLTLQEKYLALQSSGLTWIYNSLVLGEEKTIEL